MSDEPTSLIPFLAARSGECPSSLFLKIFSPTMMQPSTTMPMTRIMPKSVMLLIARSGAIDFLAIHMSAKAVSSAKGSATPMSTAFLNPSDTRSIRNTRTVP